MTKVKEIIFNAEGKGCYEVTISHKNRLYTFALEYSPEREAMIFECHKKKDFQPLLTLLNFHKQEPIIIEPNRLYSVLELEKIIKIVLLRALRKAGLRCVNRHYLGSEILFYISKLHKKGGEEIESELPECVPESRKENYYEKRDTNKGVESSVKGRKIPFVSKHKDPDSLVNQMEKIERW